MRGRGGRTAAASPRRLTRLPPPPVGSRRPAGEQTQAGKGSVLGSPARLSSPFKIHRGHINATTRRQGGRSLLCHPGKLRHRAASLSTTVSPAWGKAGGTRLWDTGALAWCSVTLNSVLNSCIFLCRLFFFLKKKRLISALSAAFSDGKDRAGSWK